MFCKLVSIVLLVVALPHRISAQASELVEKSGNHPLPLDETAALAELDSPVARSRSLPRADKAGAKKDPPSTKAPKKATAAKTPRPTTLETGGPTASPVARTTKAPKGAVPMNLMRRLRVERSRSLREEEEEKAPRRRRYLKASKAPRTRAPKASKAPNGTKAPSTKAPKGTKAPSTKAPKGTKAPSPTAPGSSKAPSALTATTMMKANGKGKGGSSAL